MILNLQCANDHREVNYLMLSCKESLIFYVILFNSSTSDDNHTVTNISETVVRTRRNQLIIRKSELNCSNTQSVINIVS